MRNGIQVVNDIWPKRKIIVFNSFPDISGNSLALYEYVLKSRKDLTHRYKLVWTVGADDTDACLRILQHRTGVKNHVVVGKKSPAGIWYFLNAKYIVSTHGYFPSIGTSKKQIHINLWHGMPFKKIGQDVEHVSGKEDKADYTISTSETFKKIMAHAFAISEDKVVVTGQPCNDFLMLKKDILRELDISEHYKKVIMWLPTYRKSVVGDIRVDGKEDSFGVSDVLSNHFEEINKVLSDNNYLLVIKPHPMDALCSMKFSQSQNIKIILNEDLSKRNLQLYELLSCCDALWTDYSSVFIDFLITGKPVAFVCDDIEEYANSRGFFFNPPQDYMSGEIVPDYTALIEYLKDMEAVNEQWKERREKMTALLNPLSDSSACERVCNEFWGLGT